ncbi:MAG TPA: hypothetical protein VF880_01830 [Actinomycetes bacterium]|jgi:hypothetical protein
MLDYAAYVTAQRTTREVVLSALPNAPSVPSEVQAPQRRRLRRGAALALHRLADRLGS